MKNIKETIIVLLGIFSYSLCDAQQVELTPSQWIKEHKNEINTTSYIFEGTVTQQNHYYGTKQTITTSIIQITKIFKGSPQLKLGSIKVVTDQGAPVINGMVTGTTSDGGGGVTINKGGTYIIFGRPAGGWSVDSTTTDNTITLTTWGMDYSIIISGNDSASWTGVPQFKTREDIYSFFKENGVTVQEQAADSAKGK